MNIICSRCLTMGRYYNIVFYEGNSYCEECFKKAKK